MSRRPGFSLLELMVAVGLGLLILRVLSLVVIPLSREIMRGFEEIDMSRTAQTLTASWGRDLTQTPPDARNLEGPANWLFRPLETRLAEGQRAFSPFLVL